MRKLTGRFSYTTAVIAALAAVLLVSVPEDTAEASHGFFAQSTGIYRIPYADGTAVTVSNDHHDHSPVNRIDMSGDAANQQIVAAASGIIRAVSDFHGDSNDLGDSTDVVDALEHSCFDGNPAVPGSVVPGKCSDHNNYVWIEHPNGEWTKYTHLQTLSASANWAVGDSIEVGEVIGIEGDIGRASGRHLHFEVGLPNQPVPAQPFNPVGGFMVPNFGVNLVPRTCDIGGGSVGLYSSSTGYTANPCANAAPTADAGGPYVVDEGSVIQFDGTGSSDPDGNPLTYLWAPDDNLDDASLAQPTYTAVDDVASDPITLTVYDQVEAISDSDSTTITVLNVPPNVTAVGDSIDEGGTATVSATFTDPGLDTHTVTIDWDDGSPAQAVTVGDINAGVPHEYGDNGTFDVTVTVTDDDGGVGDDTVQVTVVNRDPSLSLDGGSPVAFPGGEYLVLSAGDEFEATADGFDDGSDDLTFTWSFGDVNTYFNDGEAPDPAESPQGTYPFEVEDTAGTVIADPGVELISITLTDDDGGSVGGELEIIVTGNADTTKSTGWWKHQYNGNGASQLDDATLGAYLEIVNAVSSVFSESVSVTTLGEAAALLSETGQDARTRATVDLMAAWLHFASGAVAVDAEVPLKGGESIVFLSAMFEIEETILDLGASKAELKAAEDLARRVMLATSP